MTHQDTVRVQKELKFIIKLWDDDIYILTGYKSQEEIEQQIGGLEKARMPNGDIIKTSAIAKIQSFESYTFQTDQKMRHKKGQYLRGSKWFDVAGEVTDAKLERITGTMSSLPALQSPQKRLPGGKQ